MSDYVEMDNPIYEVPEGVTYLVKGKEVTGKVCNCGQLLTGYQLAGVHSCGCKPTPKAKAPSKPKAKTVKKTTAKKNKES